MQIALGICRLLNPRIKKKITENINIKITNKEEIIHCLERKDHNKYLGILMTKNSRESTI